ncbi:MAG TPA: prepilin-type N-terminal cleavage/methylation domain-containing protein [Myxococcaceae bacterium]|nr:prepilin-type N-terminal cleavage/methylation domain-containing protein [Myxococcaceae bacterium]
MSATDRTRGFTLVELMAASSVGMVIVLACLAAFDLQAQLMRNTERLLSAQASAGLGMTMMQRDLENAGIRFRGGPDTLGGNAFAAVVRPYDNLGVNITALANDTAGTMLINEVAGPVGGFLRGTDAFEVLLGTQSTNPTRVGAQVSVVTPQGLSAVTVLIAPNPFVDAEVNPLPGGESNPVVMFSSDATHCMGRVTQAAIIGTAISLTVQSVDERLAPSGAAWPANCPGSLHRVGILEQRRRYLVYRTNSAPGQPARVGLHVQSNPPCNPVANNLPCSTQLQAPAMASEGVDDLQISWRVPNALTANPNGWCQATTTDPSCGFDVPGGAISNTAANIYGAQLFLASRGNEDYRRVGEPVPILLNHVPAPLIDGVVRAVMQTSFFFRNTVTP